MPYPSVKNIRVARCSVRDRAVFLRNLKEVAAAHRTHVICFNADVMAGRAHAALAAKMALAAFREGGAISNTLEMDALLYASGSRQCRAAGAFGIHTGENRLFVCCVPSRKRVWSALESLLEFVKDDPDIVGMEKQQNLIRRFAISPEEIIAAGGESRIVDLVLERVALLRVIR